MNSRVLLCAIAGIDEAYIRESAQFDAIEAGIKLEKKKLAQRITAIGIVLALCVTVFAVVKKLPRSPEPPIINGESAFSTEQKNTPAVPSDPTREDLSQSTGKEEIPGAADDPTNRENQTEGPTKAPGNAVQPTTNDPQTERNTGTTVPADTPVPTTKAAPSSQPTTTQAPDSPFDDKTTEPPTSNSDPGGTPGAVFTSADASYSEAKDAFGHPIVACSDSDFIGYEVGIVSKNGNINADGAICLSVTYEFTNGSIGLQDQDRMTGSAANYTGEQYTYGGRTFYVQTHDESYLDYYYEIGYFPTADSGIAYQAFFDEEADIYEIMELMISLEI